MTKEEALQKIEDLKAFINQPGEPRAKEWLLDYLSQPFEVKLTKGYITYYRDGQWIFQQDFKNKILWCYYYQVWQIFENEYGMKYQQIQELIKDEVGEVMKCKELKPEGSPKQLRPVNCFVSTL